MIEIMEYFVGRLRGSWLDWLVHLASFAWLPCDNYWTLRGNCWKLVDVSVIARGINAKFWTSVSGDFLRPLDSYVPYKGIYEFTHESSSRVQEW